MTTPAPITQHDDTVVIRGAGLPMTYRAYLALIARRHRDGLAVSPLVQLAVTVLYRACMSSRRHDLAPAPPSGPSCEGQHDDLIDSATAAEILSVSRRQVQRLAPAIGIRRGSIWLFDRGAVLALADERKAAS